MLTELDYLKASEALGVDKASIKAVTQVESRGSGFLASGEPVILFERHWMYKLLVKAGKPAPINEVCNPTAGGYKGGQAEHARLAQAVSIDRECALQSASWGLFQIMGFHYKTLGYTTIQDFINAQYRSEYSQMETFIRFIKANPQIHLALKAKDWKKFAKLYNGPAYAINKYDTKLAEAYASFK